MFVYCIVYSILCILQELSKRLALFVRIRLWWKDGTGSKVLPTNQHRRWHHLHSQWQWWLLVTIVTIVILVVIVVVTTVTIITIITNIVVAILVIIFVVEVDIYILHYMASVLSGPPKELTHWSPDCTDLKAQLRLKEKYATSGLGFYQW